MIADKKIAIALSGGIDSQSLAHVILSKSNISKKVVNYCIDFKGYKKSEFKDAKKFADSYKSKIRKVSIDESYVIDNFGKLVEKNEGPLGGIMQIGMFKLAEIAKNDGYDVIGMTLRLWSEGSSEEYGENNRCCSVEDVDDARRVCQILDIPHYFVNFEKKH